MTIALVAALRAETQPVQRALGAREVSGWRHGRLFHLDGNRVLIAQAGMGRERVQAALAALLAYYRVTALVSYGYGGALSPRIHAGDLVLVEAICAAGTEPAAPTLNVDGELLALAQGALDGAPGLIVWRGQAVTTEAAVFAAEAKQALGQRHGALVVDMESLWVARLAAERRIPFLGVRAISDDADCDMPSLEGAIDANGEISWPGLAGQIVRQPREALGLPRLARDSQRASQALARFALAFIQRIESDRGRWT